LLTVGERVWEDFDPNIARMGTGWAGGVANAAELCGAVAGAVMLIGAKHGRVTLDDEDTTCLRLVNKFRRRFEDELGSIQCYHFTKRRFNPENHRKCGAVVRKAMEILLELLEGDEGEE